MGKKRIKLLNSEPEVKKTAKKIKSGKANEARLSDMGQKALEDLETIQAKEKELESKVAKKASQAPASAKATAGKPKPRSKRYLALKKNVDRNKKYPLAEAVDLVLKNGHAGFDESVDIHLNLRNKLTGSVSLPYGTGKKTRVAVADEKLIETISKGKVEFDILVASPLMMPKLAKVAKILGPKGLMPNPKDGTISNDPERLALSLSKGETRFKSEAKFPILHFTLGKVSFGKEKLTANLTAFLAAVKKPNIVNAVLCSTMGPGVKLEI